MTVLTVMGAIAAKALMPRIGVRSLVITGAVIATVGVAWLSRLPVHSAYPAHILIVGAGLGPMMFPATEAGTAGIDPRDAGLASGLLNTSRQIGGAIGLAVLVMIATTTVRHSQLTSPVEATVQGYRTALLLCSAASLAAALLLPRPAKNPATTESTEQPVAAGRPGPGTGVSDGHQIQAEFPALSAWCRAADCPGGQ
jgi:hypothetical protein